NGECESILVAKDLPYVTHLVADDSPNGYVYFTRVIAGGTVGRVSKRGGAVEVLYTADGSDRPAGLALDGQRVYWGSANLALGRYGRIHWANRNGTAPGSIGPWDQPISLMIQGGTLYWTNRRDTDVLLSIATADLGTGGSSAKPRVMYTVPTPDT